MKKTPDPQTASQAHSIPLADNHIVVLPSARAEFAGTDNPRHLRAIAALRVRSQTREAIDRVAGCSNGPDLIAELRRRDLDVPCTRIPCYDRDGREVQRGVYHLTNADRRKLARRAARLSKPEDSLSSADDDLPDDPKQQAPSAVETDAQTYDDARRKKFREGSTR